MISRVAETCFWLHRYIERVENTARMLQVNLGSVLDVHLPALARWRPFLIVAGEGPRFDELVGASRADDGEAVQDYLTWDERNPSSILTSLHWARQNARTIRETISLEMWEGLNAFWLWMNDPATRKLYRRDRHSFYARVKDSCLLFHGTCHNTILHTEPFDFMRLGMLLERAGQTARILDVKYHMSGPTSSGRETPAEAAQWLALLRSCGASESFFKRSRSGLTGPAVAEYLLLEDDFPRAVMHCLTRAHHFLGRIRPLDVPDIGKASWLRLTAIIERLRAHTIEQIIEGGIHDELTLVIDATAAVCEAVHADYFNPAVPAEGRDRQAALEVPS